MAKSVLYTNGVIAARETGLLGNKIVKMCEMSADDAFRTLTESGFAKGASARSVFEYESLLYADERDLDDFVREYAPSECEKIYFCAPRDFHNAKAAVKAHFTDGSVEGMLAPDGLVSADTICRSVKDNDFTNLYPALKEVLEEAVKKFTDEGNDFISGAEIGVLFERAKFKYLLSACKKNHTLKKFLIAKCDMTDILSAMRSASLEQAVKNALFAGKVNESMICALFTENDDKALEAFKKTNYTDFVKLCLQARAEGRPFTEAELIKDSVEIDYLEQRKYELKSKEPFIYYVLRRTAENSNLRIIFVCLMAGLKDTDIKRRLRAL
ncbi:MAG: V-type ATPase subunit [Clostridia bacterium]|nr:V-type ATPase subunit [Clostridia bacterium]